MKTISLLLLSLTIVGCSSAPTRTNEQFCDMQTKTIAEYDSLGRVVNSRTVEVMECNDNRVKRLFHVQSGMARDCGEYEYNIQLRGKLVKRLGYACKKYDGTWEVVPHPSMFGN